MWWWSKTAMFYVRRRCYSAWCRCADFVVRGGKVARYSKWVDERFLQEDVLNGFIASSCKAAGQRTASSHWLRVGGASAALAEGVAPDMIKLLGRWDSMVYKQYCRMSREAAMQLSARVASSQSRRL